MAIDDLFNSLPQILSLLSFFLSLILLFFGVRYFVSTQLEDVARLLGYAIPSLWMMMFAIYLWQIGKE